METAPANPSNSKAIASLVLGIISIISLLTFFGAIITPITSIIGIVLGTSARKTNPSGMATAGFVLSIIALSLFGLGILIVIMFSAALLPLFM